VRRLSQCLNYPEAFFFKESIEELDADTVSFRSLKKMSAKQRNSALWAGSIGLEVYDWVDSFYQLPTPNVPNLRDCSDPETAARIVRQEWGIGDRPVGNVLHLLESHGVRVLALEEDNINVDAYSFWRGDKPFMFLNTFKSAEHSIFDCAHELGHLVLHKHGGPKPSKSAEVEANRFASSFLMPEHDVKAAIPYRLISSKLFIERKIRWKVSAMALTVRLHQVGLLSDWQYRSMCIELGRLGYRSSEPKGLDREFSSVWSQVLTDLWRKKITKEDIAREIHLPYDEVECLIGRLVGNYSGGEGVRLARIMHQGGFEGWRV
jgi:Zn-dependent peptidase ImmA (M78 family)